MQAIARELKNSETAFLLPPLRPDHDAHVRFFTPTTEVPICGHATVSAHYVRALEGAPAGVIRQLTGAGVLSVEIEKSPEVGARIWMTQKPATFGRILTGEQRRKLLRALDLSADALATVGEVQVVSTGRAVRRLSSSQPTGRAWSRSARHFRRRPGRGGWPPWLRPGRSGA